MLATNQWFLLYMLGILVLGHWKDSVQHYVYVTGLDVNICTSVKLTTGLLCPVSFVYMYYAE